jgi:hypothetical protein
MQEVHGMGRQNSGFIFAHPLQHLKEHSFAHMGIQRGNRVIHKYYVTLGVHCSSKTDSGFLAPTQVDAFFPYFSLVPCWKDLKVPFELTGCNGRVVQFLVKSLSKENVLPDRHVLNPRLLLDIAEGSLLADW